MRNHVEDNIRRLESDLYMARRTIIGLMPENIQKILLSFYSCESREQALVWADDSANEIASLANAKPPNEMNDYLQNRKQGSDWHLLVAWRNLFDVIQ